jgi:hypothetical protein
MMAAGSARLRSGLQAGRDMTVAAGPLVPGRKQYCSGEPDIDHGGCERVEANTSD